jgi:hypothetical protein
MGAAALGAEVLKILKSLGLPGLILVLCFSTIGAFALRLCWKAEQAGRSVTFKINLHSLEFSIGSKESEKVDAQPQEGENRPMPARLSLGVRLRRILWNIVRFKKR